MEEKKVDNFLIKDCDLTFGKVLDKTYLSEDLKKDLSNDNVLILPMENYPFYTGPIFAELSSDIYKNFKTNGSDIFKPGICIEDTQYKEIHFRDINLRLPDIICMVYVLPIVLNILANYLYDSFFKTKKTKTMKLKIIVQKGKNKSTSIEYEGSMEDFIKGKDKIEELVLNNED